MLKTKIKFHGDEVAGISDKKVLKLTLNYFFRSKIFKLWGATFFSKCSKFYVDFQNGIKFRMEI